MPSYGGSGHLATPRLFYHFPPGTERLNNSTHCSRSYPPRDEARVITPKPMKTIFFPHPLTQSAAVAAWKACAMYTRAVKLVSGGTDVPAEGERAL